jgi:hypothetical protein
MGAGTVTVTFDLDRDAYQSIRTEGASLPDAVMGNAPM